MFLNSDDFKSYRVRDIYSQSKTVNRPLLSSYTSAFWTGYVSNHTYFDRLFKRTYADFILIDTEYGDLAEVFEDWEGDVKSILMANDKKYNELYRLMTVSDDAYNILQNYDVTETSNRSTVLDLDFVKGSQTDTKDVELYHDQKVINRDISNAYGETEVSHTGSKTEGQQTIDTDTEYSYGLTTDTTSNSKSAFNDATYTPTDQSVTTGASHTDSIDETVQKGERIDSVNLTDTTGEHTDTINDDTIEDPYTDTQDIDIVSGTRTDTTDSEETESYTNHKIGNIGVQTQSDMLAKHKDLWVTFDFYNIIFTDIAATLLRL